MENTLKEKYDTMQEAINDLQKQADEIKQLIEIDDDDEPGVEVLISELIACLPVTNEQHQKLNESRFSRLASRLNLLEGQTLDGIASVVDTETLIYMPGCSDLVVSALIAKYIEKHELALFCKTSFNTEEDEKLCNSLVVQLIKHKKLSFYEVYFLVSELRKAFSKGATSKVRNEIRNYLGLKQVKDEE